MRGGKIELEGETKIFALSETGLLPVRMLAITFRRYKPSTCEPVDHTVIDRVCFNRPLKILEQNIK